MPLSKNLEDITEADLKSLVESGTAEIKTLEYKERLPGKSNEERKEFLADVSSFANSAGGDLVYGIKESAGIPVDVCGLEADCDATVLDLEARIRDGISPRISGVHSLSIKLANGKIAFVLRIPRSYASPHMVTFGGTSRFYARASNGKFQLDIGQIRSAFLASENTSEKIRDFRAERINRILANETPIRLNHTTRLVLQIVPLSAFDRLISIDLKAVCNNRTYPTHSTLCPIGHEIAPVSRINFDGLVLFRPSETADADGYTLLYRNGIIESTVCSLLRDYQGHKRIVGPARRMVCTQRPAKVPPRPSLHQRRSATRHPA